MQAESRSRQREHDGCRLSQRRLVSTHAKHDFCLDFRTIVNVFDLFGGEMTGLVWFLVAEMRRR